MENKKIKLHLGCGDRTIPGFVNIDLRYFPGVNDVCDIRYLHPRKYPQESADLIYCASVLEHLTRWDYKAVLGRWYNILKPGGILRVSVPDFEALCAYYLKTGDLTVIRGPLYGGQDYQENFHYWCWDFSTLSNDLSATGFKKIYRYDWRKTEHGHIDDNSQAYIPHMDKDNGFFICLNVEAIK